MTGYGKRFPRVTEVNSTAIATVADHAQMPGATFPQDPGSFEEARARPPPVFFGAMGCAPSTQITGFDKLDGQLGDNHSVKSKAKGSKMRKNAVSKPVDAAMVSHFLPHAAPDDEPSPSRSRLPTADWEDCNRSDTDASSNVSVKLHVPLHLQEHIKDEPVLADFKEPLESECSWNMPSFRERTKGMPAGICFAPDRHEHDQHRSRLDDYLEMISNKPRKFEAQVYLKKMVSGMGLVGLDRAERKEANKTHKSKGPLKSQGLIRGQIF